MNKATKLALLLGAMVIALCATYFVWLQPEGNAPLIDSIDHAEAAKQEVLAQTEPDVAGTGLAESNIPAQQSLALSQVQERVRLQKPERPRTRHNADNSFSPVLDQVVSQQQIDSDRASYVKEVEEMGLATYLHGDKSKPVYGLLAGVKNRPDSLYQKFDNTVEELVDMARQGDSSAMLSLANRAWAAGHWAEGDIYAFEAARMANSWEPLIHGASRRLGTVGMGYQDPEGASWFLAAYLTGEIAAAVHVGAYFRFMSPENQVWALERAHEIINEVNIGG